MKSWISINFIGKIFLNRKFYQSIFIFYALTPPKNSFLHITLCVTLQKWRLKNKHTYIHTYIHIRLSHIYTILHFFRILVFNIKIGFTKKGFCYYKYNVFLKISFLSQFKKKAFSKTNVRFSIQIKLLFQLWFTFSLLLKSHDMTLIIHETYYLSFKWACQSSKDMKINHLLGIWLFKSHIKKNNNKTIFELQNVGKIKNIYFNNVFFW